MTQPWGSGLAWALAVAVGVYGVGHAGENEDGGATPVTARLSASTVTFRTPVRTVATLSFGAFANNWQHTGAKPGPTAAADDDTRRLRIAAANGVHIDVDVKARTRMAANGGPSVLDVRARFTSDADGVFQAVTANIALPYALVGGQPVALDGQAETRAVAPGTPGRPLIAADGAARRARVAVRGVGELELELDGTPLLFQDGRHWGGRQLDIRLQPAGGEAWTMNETRELAFTLSLPGGITMEKDQPVTIRAGAEWIPLDEPTLELLSGSALDFSAWPERHEPAGRFGRVTTRDGRFVFADDPEARPRRFYGVNFCFSAHYLEGDQPERLATRLARMGYNTVRIHHYEQSLVNRPDTPPGDSTVPGAKELDQLDRFFAAMKARGLYMTTDLFVSRPVWLREVWPDAGEGPVRMDDFKMAVPVNERAYANFIAFARTLLTHRNPHTGLTWAEDPALAWLSLINEGNFGNFLHNLPKNDRLAADWQRAYEAWCARQPWDEAPPATMPTRYNAQGRDGAILRRFLADTEIELFARVKKFLREDIGCAAPLTNANAWSYDGLSPITRADYDYVDDHFYIDHPEFPEKPWSLPSRCPNESTVARGSIGGGGSAALRLAGKPMTISEFNYSAPGRFRAVGGLLTGAMAARQDWDILWRFAYAHSRNVLFTPSRMAYFDIASDPLNQVAERAALCLFLRGDLPPAEAEVRVVGDAAAFQRVNDESAARGGSWENFALAARLTTELAARPAASGQTPDGDGPFILTPAEVRQPEAWGRMVEALRQRGWKQPPAHPADALKIGEPERDAVALTLDPGEDRFIFSTPRTAGGYAAPGQRLDAGAVTLTFGGTNATAWVSAVDGGASIDAARRLIVCHLTDVQNTGARYAESARQTLLDWGGMPWLALDGTADVAIRRAPDAPRLRAWALALSGERREELPVAVDAEGRITLQLAVKGEKGARLLYELAEE